MNQRPPDNLFDDPLEDAIVHAAEELDRASKEGKPRQRFYKPEELRSEVESMLLGRTPWANAQPEHFVELASGLHERVYGVFDEDARGQPLRATVKIAGTVLRETFKQRGIEMANFIRWVWKRQRDREKWNKDNGRVDNTFRLSVRATFSRSQITDYRVWAGRLR